MKKFILSSLFMMSIVLLYGQTEGVVIDSFNKPLEAVDVFLVDQNHFNLLKRYNAFF